MDKAEAAAGIITKMPLELKTLQIHSSVEFENAVVLGFLSAFRGENNVLGKFEPWRGGIGIFSGGVREVGVVDCKFYGVCERDGWWWGLKNDVVAVLGVENLWVLRLGGGGGGGGGNRQEEEDLEEEGRYWGFFNM